MKPRSVSSGAFLVASARNRGGGKAVASSLGSRLCARLQMTNALPPHWLPLTFGGRKEPLRPARTFRAGRP